MSAHHGNTLAAWAGVGLSMIGFVVGGIALMTAPVSMPLFWIGAVLTVAGFPAFLVLSKLGYNS